MRSSTGDLSALTAHAGLLCNALLSQSYVIFRLAYLSATDATRMPGEENRGKRSAGGQTVPSTWKEAYPVVLQLLWGLLWPPKVGAVVCYFCTGTVQQATLLSRHSSHIAKLLAAILPHHAKPWTYPASPSPAPCRCTKSTSCHCRSCSRMGSQRGGSHSLTRQSGMCLWAVRAAWHRSSASSGRSIHSRCAQGSHKKGRQLDVCSCMCGVHMGAG